jgi:predicted nucleotidyltransferase component of viral defense system
VRRTLVNIPESIRSRLLTIAHANGEDYNALLRRYFQERLLFRIARSELGQHLYLKGGLLLVAYGLPAPRATIDIDFLGHELANRSGEITAAFARAVALPCPEDGVLFDADSIHSETIRANAEYHGARIKVMGSLGVALLPISVDIAFGSPFRTDELIDYPVLLDDTPAPHVCAYSLDYAVSEKFEAMVQFGLDNSRLKDFYDIWYLARHRTFFMGPLQSAVKSTFEFRGTSLSRRTIVFDDAFASSIDRQRSWQAWIARTGLVAPTDFIDVMHAIIQFLDPVCQERAEDEHWDPASQRWVSGTTNHADGSPGTTSSSG